MKKLSQINIFFTKQKTKQLRLDDKEMILLKLIFTDTTFCSVITIPYFS